MHVAATFDTDTGFFTVESDLESYEASDPVNWCKEVEVGLGFASQSEFLNPDGLWFGFRVAQEGGVIHESHRPYENETLRVVKPSFAMKELVAGQEETETTVVFRVDIDGSSHSAEFVFDWPRHPSSIPADAFGPTTFVVLGDD